MFPEIRKVLLLAIPVALAELGWVGMSVVDTIMVGALGPVAIGAIALGSSAFYAFGIFGIGLLLGMDTLVSQAHGGGDGDDAHRTLAAGLTIAFLLGPVLTLLFWVSSYQISRAGIAPEVSALAGQFLRALGLSSLPLLVYAALRRYLQATGSAGPVTFALISANVVNWFFNWLLIRGHWGAPALGVTGSAVSTVGARVHLALFLGFVLWRRESRLGASFRSIHLRPDLERVRAILSIGMPAAFQILLEIGAFGFTAFLAGRLTPAALAAHQIAINAASVTYMVPLGISSAAAVVVGHAVGAGDHPLARLRGYIALSIAAAYELCSAAAFLLLPRRILAVYTTDTGVIRIGLSLLALAAAFQLFDGLQAVGTGALRGIGSTRMAMLVNLGGYWLFGLPLGYYLCFYRGQGVYGLWLGLTVALVVIAVVLCIAWHRMSGLNRQRDPGRAA